MLFVVVNMEFVLGVVGNFVCFGLMISVVNLVVVV